MNIVLQCLSGPRASRLALRAHTAIALGSKAAQRAVQGGGRAYMPARGQVGVSSYARASRTHGRQPAHALLPAQWSLRSGGLPISGPCLAQEPAPNMSLKLTRYGKAARPRGAHVHHAPRGRAASPPRAA